MHSLLRSNLDAQLSALLRPGGDSVGCSASLIRSPIAEHMRITEQIKQPGPHAKARYLKPICVEVSPECDGGLT
jgi:hypothetical protein